MEPESEQAEVAADEVAAEQPTSAEPEGPPRVPQMGTLGAMPPLHTGQFAIEHNVSRIATEIALGRPATYD
jgi:hypothetical protein